MVLAIPRDTQPRRCGVKVLVVDDEPALARALAINLRAHGWEVVTAADGRSALEAAANEHPDVVVLDLGLPDLDGTEVISGLRGWTKVPIVVLSARQHGEDKVEALDLGADDYVTKPFAMNELMARLRAAVRRAAEATPEVAVVEVGDLTIDLARKRVASGRERRLAHAYRVGLPRAARPQRRTAGHRASRSCARCGGRRTRRRPTTSACTPPSSAASSRPTRRIRAT